MPGKWRVFPEDICTSESPCSQVGDGEATSKPDYIRASTQTEDNKSSDDSSLHTSKQAGGRKQAEQSQFG